MKTSLTEKQRKAYDFIRTYIRKHHLPPTMTEIGNASDIRSINGVSKVLDALEKKGLLRRIKNTARGIQITDPEEPVYYADHVPSIVLINRANSFEPDKLRDRPTGYLLIDPYFLRNANGSDRCLVGRTSDDGMSGEGIIRGDFIVIEEVAWDGLAAGELVAILVQDKLVARRFFLMNDRIHLRPADRNYLEETFQVGEGGYYVIGRIVSLLRKY